MQGDGDFKLVVVVVAPTVGACFRLPGRHVAVHGSTLASRHTPSPLSILVPIASYCAYHDSCLIFNRTHLFLITT